MQDLYEYSNVIEGLPQVKYVQIRRNISEEILEAIYAEMKPRYDGWDKLTGLNDTSLELMKQWRFWTPREYILHHCIRDKDLTNEYKSEEIAYA